jgi:citrate/tricarballylate utilization protein
VVGDTPGAGLKTRPYTDALRKAEHEMVVCNACRYCEAYCPVFQAMEQRIVFSPGDLTYLANLCHNCGECLYACQYAPPHEFGIDVPKTMSKLRVESYESFAWPSFAAAAFRWPWATTLAAVAVSALVLSVFVGRPFTGRQIAAADFYGIISHATMVTIFGIAGLLVVLAVGIGHRRFALATHDAAMPGHKTTVMPGRKGPMPGREAPAYERAATDALTLKHLHATGEDCVDAEERRRPWRRWMHHCTFYGFALCFASTTVAAIYHLLLGWIAPYAYTSLPVILGTLGGVGLLIGPGGLFLVDRRRDRDLTHLSERSLGGPFLALLFLTSLTGLLLMVLRTRPSMPALLVVHLAVVLALFVTLPYGKFVHGIYRAAALMKFRREEQTDGLQEG